LAEHEAAVPPFEPEQVQPQGPVPAMEDAEPTLQSAVVGALLKVRPFEAPQLPFTGVGAARLAEHEAAAPPLAPKQVQPHGPEPVMEDAEPTLQSAVVGALLKVRPFEMPQLPFTGAGAAMLAEQAVVVPPLEPAQVQPHGPEPVTEEALPVLQKPEVGTLFSVEPFEMPHAPFTAAGCCCCDCAGAEHDMSLPP
jgi:hypothetical protein